jgi:hypothetical protein
LVRRGSNVAPPERYRGLPHRGPLCGDVFSTRNRVQYFSCRREPSIRYHVRKIAPKHSLFVGRHAPLLRGFSNVVAWIPDSRVTRGIAVTHTQFSTNAGMEARRPGADHRHSVLVLMVGSLGLPGIARPSPTFSTNHLRRLLARARQRLRISSTANGKFSNGHSAARRAISACSSICSAVEFSARDVGSSIACLESTIG